MTPRPMKRTPPLLLLVSLLFGFFAVSHAQQDGWDLELTVASSTDDAEEFLEASRRDAAVWPSGFSYTSSSDLELGADDDHAPQLVGLRFTDVQIPPGAAIEAAVLRFTADSNQSGPLELVVEIQASSAAPAFTQDPEGQASSDLSSRATTGTAVAWSPEAWSQGFTYDSPDLSGLLQEVVGDPSWRGSGSLALFVRPASSPPGSLRSAFSFDGQAGQSPRLLVRFSDAPTDPAGGDDSTGPEVRPAGAEPPAAAADEAGEPVPDAPAAPAGPADAPPAEEPRPAEPVPAEAAEKEPVETAEEPLEPEPAVPEPAEPGPAQEGAAPERAEPEPVEPPPARPEPAEPEQVAPEEPGEPGPAGGAVGEIGPVQRPLPAPLRDPQRTRYELVGAFERGASGSVLVSDYGNGVAVVTVLIDSPDVDASYPVSVRTGNCSEGGELVARLEPVDGRRGLSTSLLDVDYAELTAGSYQLLVYRTVSNMTRIVGCAQLGG